MKLDLFEKNVRKEERLFLSLCSPEDKQKLMQQIPMTFNDYLRITCIIFHMNLVYYEAVSYTHLGIMSARACFDEYICGSTLTT